MRVLIIGGGIGGLTAALALRHCDVPAVVYTAAPGDASEKEDAGLWLPPGAMQVFDWLDVAGAVREAGPRLERAVVERQIGRAHV